MENMRKTISSIFQLADQDLRIQKMTISFYEYLIYYIKKSNGGIINVHQLKKNAVNFVKDAFFFKDKTQIFKLFLFALGIDDDGFWLSEHSDLNNIFLL